ETKAEGEAAAGTPFALTDSSGQNETGQFDNGLYSGRLLQILVSFAGLESVNPGYWPRPNSDTGGEFHLPACVAVVRRSRPAEQRPADPTRLPWPTSIPGVTVGSTP